MSMDLRTITLTPLRQTFGHLARRLGADKPASRYLEGTMDLQPVENFHYRPTWDPEHEIFDPRRTRVALKDWYTLKDPRQYYYGAWVLARGRMQENAGADFDLVEEMALAASYASEGKQLALDVLLPLRHVAWAANLNNSYIGAYGYGIAISQAAAYASMDQLGVAQYLTRLAFAFDDIDALSRAKSAWMNDAAWQPLRQLVEDMMVTSDWFELFVAQDFVLNGLLYPLIYDSFNEQLNVRHGPVISLLTRFQREWYGETTRWVDAVIKAAATDPDHGAANKALLNQWAAAWRERALAALAPLSTLAFSANGAATLDKTLQQLNSRGSKAGLAI